MSTTNLCGNPKCCPSIEEDEKTGIMYIVDGDQKIAFNKEQQENLAKYMRNKVGCACESCTG